MLGVDVRQAQRVSHVHPTHQNRQLHLIRVGEKQIVLGPVPHPIKTEWVSVAALQRSLNNIALLEILRPLPCRWEDGHGAREDIVVDETGVH